MSERSRRRPLTVLGRIAERNEAGRALLRRALEMGGSEVLEEALEAAEEGIPAIGEVLAQVLGGSGDADLAERIHARIHVKSRSLRELALTAVTLGQAAAAADPDRASERASWSNNRALRLAAVGRHDDALEALDDALRLEREALAAQGLHDSEVLAATLLNQSTVLSSVGRRPEAVDAVERAVRMFRRLGEGGGAHERRALGLALGNLGLRLLETAALTRSESVIVEAIALQEGPAASGDPPEVVSLATSVANLARVRLADGRPGAALDPARRAVALLQPVVDRHEDAHLGDLVRALACLAEVELAVGLLAPARHHLREALGILTPTFLRQPESFVADWVALRSVLGRIEETAQPGGASRVLAETAQRLAEHATAGPRTHDALWVARHNLAWDALGDGRPDQAVAHLLDASHSPPPRLVWQVDWSRVRALWRAGQDGEATLHGLRLVDDLVACPPDRPPPPPELAVAVALGLEHHGFPPRALLRATTRAREIAGAHAGAVDPQAALQLERAHAVALAEAGEPESGLAVLDGALQGLRALAADGAPAVGEDVLAAWTSKVLLELQLGRIDAADRTATALLEAFDSRDGGDAAEAIRRAVAGTSVALVRLNQGATVDALRLAIPSLHALVTAGARGTAHEENARMLVGQLLVAVGEAELGARVLAGEVTPELGD